MSALAIGACATASAPHQPPPATSGGAAATTTAASPTPALTGGSAAAFEVQVTLAIGTPVRLDDGTAVTLRDVTDDYRCPSDATCLWAGDATLTIAVEPRGGTAGVVTLHTGLGDTRSAVVAGYRLALERLEPEPTTTRPVARPEYRAFFAISK